MIFATTAEKVSRFQCLVPNPNWLVWKGIPPPKTHSNDGDFSTSGRVKSCSVRGLVVYPGANVRPWLSMEESDVFKIKDDDVGLGYCLLILFANL